METHVSINLAFVLPMYLIPKKMGKYKYHYNFIFHSIFLAFTNVNSEMFIMRHAGDQ